ncbi:isopentenyl-diphosphate Delta-isomerase [Saccharopolyspora halophila]|uniref:Isopentenyl-diphosphate Delta-isomerase n=1 Tax=Saccharopolyspora halophila TaxID=405551 RepID=A0ABN3G5G8_9PSEU
MEQVVLLDETGEAIGVEDKATVHHQRTPLHLAFSCYVFNDRGEFLLTQRAHHKRTFPSVWTNTCCGHPAPYEEMKSAITRRLGEELGLRVRGLELVLPGFRYRAEMDNVVENEMCPVFVAFTSDSPTPNADEVAEARWVPWKEFSTDVLADRTEVSPWCRLQVEQLDELGADPARWPTGAPVQLPPAAQVA